MTPHVSYHLKFAADLHRLPPASITNRDLRSRHITRARHELFWRLVESKRNGSTRMSIAQMGQQLGFDHTALLYGAARHAEREGYPAPTKYNLANKRAKDRAWQAAAKERVAA